MKVQNKRITTIIEDVPLNKGVCRKFKNSYSVAEIYFFDEKAIKNREYGTIIKENPNNKAGVYILKGKAQLGYANPYYVGETSNIYARTKQHETDKLDVMENAESMIFITSINGDIFRNISNRKILEHKFATLENLIGHENISKTNCPQTNDEYDVRRFFEDVFFILSNSLYCIELATLKVDKVWNSKVVAPQLMKKGSTYRRYNLNGEVTATIVFDGLDKIHLLKGSYIEESLSTNMDDKHYSNIENKYNDLKKANAYKNGIMTKDYTFNSPYALGCILTGTSCNITYDTNWYNDDGYVCVFPSLTMKKKKEKKKLHAA